MKKVILFLAQGFEEYEAAVFTDVLGWSRTYGIEPVEVVTVGLRSEIKCTWNLIVKPQFLLNEIDINEFDALAIPGGFEECGFYEDAYKEEFLDLLRKFNSEQKIIASVCVAALALGKSGILNGRRATTYHMMGGKRRKQLADFGAVIENSHVVVDDNIITSTSPAAAIDTAFTLLEKLTTRKNVLKVKEGMGYD